MQEMEPGWASQEEEEEDGVVLAGGMEGRQRENEGWTEDKARGQRMARLPLLQVRPVDGARGAGVRAQEYGGGVQKKRERRDVRRGQREGGEAAYKRRRRERGFGWKINFVLSSATLDSLFCLAVAD